MLALDRAEGALRVAEKALAEVATLKAKIAELEAAPLGAVSAIIAEKVTETVSSLPPPEKGADGIGMAGALIDREGHLIITMTNGEIRDLGMAIGNDGERGRDGFGFDDMDACVLDDDRTIELSFRRGDEEKAFTFKWPTAIYRSVYREGEQYDAGDMVTWAGSLWHCDEQTKDKPGTDAWTLAAKKGRDGKDAK